jgi:hypothetical protein
MIIPLTLGLLWENWRLSRSLYAVQAKLLGALLSSLLTFVNSKGEIQYDFERHLEFWPYSFIAIFTIISAFYHEKQVVVPLGEGITLLQSLALAYLAIERNWFDSLGKFGGLVVSLVSIFCLYALFHAFTKQKLTKQHRLFLSIISSIAMLIFASDHIKQVLTSENTSLEFNKFIGVHGLEFFLLGVALMYIFQNFWMLQVYFPAKNRFYGKLHRDEIIKMNDLHVARFDRSQLAIIDALLIVVLTPLIYFLNYKFSLLHDHTLIWMLIAVFPMIVTMRKKT